MDGDISAEGQLRALEHLRAAGLVTDEEYRARHTALVDRAVDEAARAPLEPLAQRSPASRLDSIPDGTTPISAPPPRPAPFRRTGNSGIWVLVALVVLGAGGFSAYRFVPSSQRQSSTTGEAPESSPGLAAGDALSSTAAPTAAAGDTSMHPLGTRVSGPNGSSITAYQMVSGLTTDNEYDQPSPGHTRLAVDVELCAGSTFTDGSSTALVGPTDFVLVNADNTRVDTLGAPDLKQPSFPITNLALHQCVRGWVNFDVTVAPAAILVDGSTIGWSLRQ